MIPDSDRCLCDVMFRESMVTALSAINVPTGNPFRGIGRSGFFSWMLCGFLFFPLWQGGCATLRAGDRPNVVMIMTDNHGAWTLGCYGNDEIRTPNIDRMASEGTLFERAFANNPVCSPTRATVLTGLMPSQHGVHCFLTGGRLQVGPDARCTLDQLTSLPELLNARGYACGLIGKWHLGGNLEPQEGFDAKWLTMPHGGTSTFYDAKIIRDGKVESHPGYLTDYWTQEAKGFIESHANQEQPFFLFLSYNGPYALSRLMLREGRNRHASVYAQAELESFPNGPIHPWQYSNRDYQNNSVSNRRVATEVSGVDDGVGEILNSLRDSGIDRNTVVIFLADQGWSGGHGGFYGMGDHTRPVTARDPMMQIPMIWSHPGVIRAGARLEHMVANYDVMPSLLSYLNLPATIPSNPASPGKDFSPLLTEKNRGEVASVPKDDPVFFEFEGLRCVRTSGWKLVQRHPEGPHELFDLSSDPGEENNLYEEERHRKDRVRLQHQLNQFFGTYRVPQYDLWNGGRSQTRLFVGSSLIDEEAGSESVAVPDVAVPDVAVPDVAVPDVAVPDVAVPDVAVPDVAVPDVDSGSIPFDLPEGYFAEQVAQTPLVTHPTMACLDDRGRLYVCNNSGVNLNAEQLQEALPNEIRMLEDVDGDGRYDRSTVFADQMTFPMGGAWHDGSLYVASPPFIWKLQDVDGDGVADRREKLVSQFGFTGNAASIHGCFSGPDGRLYWCDGYHGHEFKDQNGAVTSRREGSYLFSCRTDGSDVRRHCGGGMDNPVEVDFTPSGDMIGTVNILYHRPRVDALVHWLYGGAYPHRERVLTELQVTGSLLGPIHPFGHVAVSGMTRYRSGAMDRRWQDQFFCTFFNSGRVARVQLAGAGSTYHAEQRPFLVANSDDFHPTDVLEDADGSLLVIDTGGWFYRGCPTSQRAKPDVMGGIYRVRRSGMSRLPDPWGKRLNWKDMDGPRVVKHFNDTRHAVRERAIAESVKRGDTMLPQLEKALRADIRVRRNAAWVLARMLNAPVPLNREPVVAAVGRTPATLLRRLLRDSDSTVRQIACHALADDPSPDHVPDLIVSLQDESAGVRREAATTLGRCGDLAAAEPLVEALAKSDGELDRSGHHSITHALMQLKALDSLASGQGHEHSSVRRACLSALRQLAPEKLSIDELFKSLSGRDSRLREAAFRALTTLERSDDALTSEDRRELHQGLSAWIDQYSGNTTEADLPGEPLRQILSEFVHVRAVSERLAQRLESGSPLSTRRLALQAVVDSGVTTVKTPLWDGVRRSLESEDQEERRLAIAVAGQLGLERYRSKLEQIRDQTTLSGPLRIEALRSLQRDKASIDGDALNTLTGLLDGDSSDRSSAAEMLAASQLTAAQLIKLAPRLRSAGATDLKILIRPFSRRADPEVAEAFLDALDSARSLAALNVPEFSDVVKRFPDSSLHRANQILDRLKESEKEREITLGRLLGKVSEGDRTRGEIVFYSEKSRCSVCHRVGDKGGLIGPDLSTIGANRSVADLAESILFPSASIVRQYESQNVLTESGRTYAGIVVRQSHEQLVLMQPSGESVSIATDEIERVQAGSASVMPSGLEAALGDRSVIDLITFLKTLGIGRGQESETKSQ